MRISRGVLVAAAATSTWGVVALPQITGATIPGQTTDGFFETIDDWFHYHLLAELDEGKSIASHVVSDIEHLGDVFGPTGSSNAQDPAAITQTPTGPTNAGGGGAQPVVTETTFTVNQLQNQPKITTAQPQKTHWWQYFAGQKTTATTAVSAQASSTPSTKTTSRTKKGAKTTSISASMPVTSLADVPAEVKSWINNLPKKSRTTNILKVLNAAKPTAVPSPVREWFGNHTDFAALTQKEFNAHFDRLSRAEALEIHSFFKRLSPDDRKLPLQSVVSGSIPMPVKTWYEALPNNSVTLPAQSFMTRLPKIKGDLPFGTKSLMVVVPTAGPKVQSYLEAIPTESQKLPLQSIITHIPKANLPEDVKAYQDALRANGDAKLPISVVIDGIKGYQAPSTVYLPMDDKIRETYRGAPKSEVFKFIADKDPNNPNYKATQYKTASITAQPSELPSAKAPVASITGQLAPGDRPAPPAPTPFTFPASALPKVSDIKVLLKQSSISAASGAAESAISRFEPWFHWQSEGPKPTDNLESVIVSYFTKHRPTPTSVSQIEASLRSSMKKKHIQLSSGVLHSVLVDYLDLPPGASPTPSPSNTVQSFVFSWLSKNRPIPTYMDADAAKISKILYKQAVYTSPGALLSALNNYRASPTAAPSDAVQTVVVSYYNAEHAKSAISDIFNQSSMTVKTKDFDKAFGKYYHPPPITTALPTPSTPIETVVASYLAEHNEGGYPGPYLPSSLIALKNDVGAILSKGKIPAPTGALESAISRFHNATSTPTPTNALESALVSYLVDQKHKSAIASIISVDHKNLGKYQDWYITSAVHQYGHPTGSQPVPKPTNYVEYLALTYFAGQSLQGSSLTQLTPSESTPTGAPELTPLFGSAVSTPLPGFSGSSSALGASQTGSITNQIKAFQDNSTGTPQLSSSFGGLSSQASNSGNIVAPTAAFSGLSSVLGASKAASITNQITASQDIPTEAPQVSSSLGPLSSEMVNAEKLTAPTSLRGSEDLSSALGASRPFRKEDFKNTALQVSSMGVPGVSSVSNQIPSSQNVNAEASATISSLPVDMPVSMSLSAPALAPSSSVPRTEVPESTSMTNSGSVMQAAAMSQPSSNIESPSMVFSALTSGSVPEILSASNILSSSPGSVAKSDITSFESSSIYPTRLPKSALSFDSFSELRSSVQSVVASEADFHAKHFADSQTTAVVSQPVSSSSPMISSAMSEGMRKPTSVAASNIASGSGMSPSIKSESSSIETTMPTSTGGFKFLFSSAFGITSSQSANELSTTGEIQPTFFAQSGAQQTVSSGSSFEATSRPASERLPGFSSFISSWKAQSSLAAARSGLSISLEGLSSPSTVSGLSVASSSVQASLASDSVQKTASMSNTLVSQSATRHSGTRQSAASQTASFSQSSNPEAIYFSALAQQLNTVSSLQPQSPFHAKQFNVHGAVLKSSTKAIPTAVSAKSSSPMKASTSVQGESSIVSSWSLAVQSESSQAMTKSLPLPSSLAIQSLASVSAQESLSSEQAALSASRSLPQSSAFSANQVASATQNIGSPSASVVSQLSMSTAVSPSKSLELTSERQPALMSTGISLSDKASASPPQSISATSAQVQPSIISALEMLRSSGSASLASEASPSSSIPSVQASQIPSVLVSTIPLSSEASTLSVVNAESSVIQSSSSVIITPSTAVNTGSNVPNMASETLTSMATSSLGALAQHSVQSINFLPSTTLLISSSDATPVPQATSDVNMPSSMAVSQPQNVASEAQRLSSVGPSEMGFREQNVPESVVSQTSLLQQKTISANVAPSSLVENSPGTASTTDTSPYPTDITLTNLASFATSMTSATPEAESTGPGANTAISQSDKAMAAAEMPTELNSSQVFASNAPFASTPATAQTGITFNVPQVTQSPMDTTFQRPSAIKSPLIPGAPSEAVLVKTIISIDTVTITVTDHGPEPTSDAQPTNAVGTNGFYSSAPAPEPKLTPGSEMDYVTAADMEQPESTAAKEFYDATKSVDIPDSSLLQNLTPITAVASASPTLQYATAIDLVDPEPSPAAEDSYKVNNFDVPGEDSTSPQSASHNNSNLGHSDEFSHPQENWAHIGEDRLQTSQNAGNEGENASNGNERESSQPSSEDSGSSTNTNESNNQSHDQSAPYFQGGNNQTAPAGKEEGENQAPGPQTQATAYQPETGNNRQNMTSSSSQEASADSERQIPSDTRPPPASNNLPQGNSDEQPEWQSPPPPKNNIGELSTPAPEPRPTGSLTFAPELNSNVNFFDGKVYDVSGKTSGSKERITQAEAINNDLPSSIQKAFNDNAINYYDPGTGDFYFTKTCQGSVCNIRQVARSCNCYLDAADGQMKTMSFDQNDKLQPSVHNWDTQLPPATRHTVKEGDTLRKVAAKYGVELGSMIAANPHISNPNVVSAGQSLNVPGQSYTVVPGDSMWQIAQTYGVPYEALRALNPQIPNPNQIIPGQVLKVPAARMEDPFVYTAPSTGGSSSSPNKGVSSSGQQKDGSAYTVKAGDSLWSIAQKFGVTLEEISAVNPLIKDKDLIYPGQLVNVPVYLPAQGSIKYQVSSSSEVQKRSVEAGSWVDNATKRVFRLF